MYSTILKLFKQSFGRLTITPLINTNQDKQVLNDHMQHDLRNRSLLLYLPMVQMIPERRT